VPDFKKIVELKIEVCQEGMRRDIASPANYCYIASGTD